MTKRFKFAGSILSADILNLEHDIDEAINCGIDIIHFDAMDFHFVPNLSFGPNFLRAMHRRFPYVVFDVHLMMSDLSLQMVSAFIEAGASWISIHPESTVHVDQTLQFIAEHGVKPGIVLNPGTSTECLQYLWDKIDHVLVMSVNPGFGGQPFIRSSLQKIAKVREMALEAGVHPLIEVDGGIDSENVVECARAGASCFVVGSHFFGQSDKTKALEDLHRSLEEGVREIKDLE